MLNRLLELSRALPAERQTIAHRTRGLRYFWLERYPQAFADFDLAVLLSPQRPDLYFHRGRAQHALGNLQAALVRSLAGARARS
jgi:tetratricopeptide (TPR) repeat protein